MTVSETADNAYVTAEGNSQEFVKKIFLVPERREGYDWTFRTRCAYIRNNRASFNKCHGSAGTGKHYDVVGRLCQAIYKLFGMLR